jgi:16S rRNA (cytosine967-C5)-methyltransferase
MKTAAAANARQLALSVLLACRKHEGFVQELLHQQLAQSTLTGPDRRLATQLAYGVLRRRASLDALLRPLLARPLGAGKEDIQETLRLGAFQLALLDQIPVHAAVHETVELVAPGKMRGLVNAVLRNVARSLTAETSNEPAANALPVESGEFRVLARPILPDPGEQPAEYLADAFALPLWLARRWLPRWGWEECLRLGFWFISTPPLWLRVNALRNDRSAFLAACAAQGVAAEPGPHPQSVRLTGHVQVRELPGYAEGWFAVQDHSAMTVAEALAPAPGAVVLDLCAAPGGKTTHLAELMANQGQIVACDVREERLQTLRDQAGRVGAAIVETRLVDPGRPDDIPAGPFDAILADVPCSNTGVLGRRPEARWRLGESDLADMVQLQTSLLSSAAQRLKPGGKLVYATCSIEPDENQRVVAAVIKAMPILTLQAEQELRPGQPADGGYWALLRRAAD